MRGIARGDGVGGQLRQIPPETGVLCLKQKLHARIFQDHPEIMNQAGMGIETEQRGKRIRHRLVRTTISPARGFDQIHERFHPKTIRAELQMAGLVRSHDEIEPLILLRSGIPPQESRQHNGLSIRADHRTSRWHHDRFRKGRDGYVRTTETLNKELYLASHLSERDAAERLFDL